MTIRLVVTFGLVLGCLSIGCTKDDSESGRAVDPNKQADELSESEAGKVCNSLNTQLDRLNQPKPTCYGEALGAMPEDADACEELYDSCVERNAPLRLNISGCTAAGVQSCTGKTVSDLVGCYTALADFVTDLSCEILDSETVESDAEVTGCVTELSADCPGLFTTVTADEDDGGVEVDAGSDGGDGDGDGDDDAGS